MPSLKLLSTNFLVPRLLNFNRKLREKYSICLLKSMKGFIGYAN